MSRLVDRRRQVSLRAWSPERKTAVEGGSRSGVGGTPSGLLWASPEVLRPPRSNPRPSEARGGPAHPLRTGGGVATHHTPAAPPAQPPAHRRPEGVPPTPSGPAGGCPDPDPQQHARGAADQAEHHPRRRESSSSRRPWRTASTTRSPP